MNDRFRFRIWFEIGKKYVYFGKPIINIKGLGRAEGTGLLFEILPGQTMYLGHNNIEQCTGLKDKNGRLIYEGDIVERARKIDYDTVNLQIEWNKKSGRYITTDARHRDWNFSMFEYDYEVIGNIHENPELLEDN